MTPPAPPAAAADPPPVAPRGLVIADVAVLLGVSAVTVERLHAAGKMPAPRRLGRSNRWDADELHAWFARPRPDGKLMDRREWRGVWAALVRRQTRPSVN